MPSKTYRPRCAATLTVAVSGPSAKRNDDDFTDDPITFPVRVRKAVLEQNDHNHADTLHITVEWADAGVDPRLLSSATIKFYLGDADFWSGAATQDGQFILSDKNLRFVGIAVNIKRIAKDGDGFSVEMEFHDYTAIFLECKPFVSAGVPFMDMTIEDAWGLICENTGFTAGDGSIKSSVTSLKNRLSLSPGISAGTRLSRACAPRFAKLAKVSVKSGCDAWAVWQQCCGMLGLITYVSLDNIIVTTSTDYYTKNDPPRLIWGKNIVSWQETRKAHLFAKGVGLTSFDALTGTTIEALWPAPGDPAILHKRMTAKHRADPTAVRKASEYEYFAVPDVTSQAALLDCAKRVYDERSRQEMEGSLETVEMSVTTASGADFDLLSLGSGDVVRIELGDDLRELGVGAAGAPTTLSSRKWALMARGYSEGAAELIAANLDDIARLDATFFVKTVRTSLEFSDDGGEFKVTIGYANRIKVSGDGSPE